MVYANMFVDWSSLTLDWHVRQLVMHKNMKHDPFKKHTEWTLKLRKKRPIARASCLFQIRDGEMNWPVKSVSTCSVTALHTLRFNPTAPPSLFRCFFFVFFCYRFPWRSGSFYSQVISISLVIISNRFSNMNIFDRHLMRSRHSINEN